MHAVRWDRLARLPTRTRPAPAAVDEHATVRLDPDGAMPTERIAARRWRLVRASKIAIPPSVRRFNQRARAHRLRTARPWLVVAGVLVIAGLIGWLLYGTSVLGVDRIRVTGAGFVGSGAVREAARVPIGTPLASVDTGAVEARVDKIPGVRRADVHRDWPSTLVVVITPRTPYAAVPHGSSFLLIDASGVPFRTVAAQPDLPVITLTSPGARDGSTRAALTVLRALPPEIGDQLISMSAESPVDVILVLANHQRVIWGDASDNAAKGRVALSLLNRPGTVTHGTTIDVSAPNVVTVR